MKLSGVGGKVQLVTEMAKSLANQGGVTAGTVALGDVAAVDPNSFMQEVGTAAVPLYMRNWGEQKTHSATPISLRVEAKLADPAYAGAPATAQPYMVSKSRHKWVLSTTPGGTKIIV